MNASGKHGNFRPLFACTFLQRARGLIGRVPSWLGDDGVLVLAPCSSIHTFCMRSVIDVAFLDREGVVLKTACAVPPCKIVSCAGAEAALERFSNSSCGRPPRAWFEAGERVFLGHEMGGL